MMVRRWWSLLIFLFLLPACGGTRELPPDDRFGHRYEETGPDNRPTLEPAPASPDVDYLRYPVFIDSVHVRQGAADPAVPAADQRVAVEILVKGAFPDSCFELDGVRQERIAHMIRVDVEARKPREAVCRRVHRPFRHYFLLDGSYRPGHYTLVLNGAVMPFQVHEAGR